MMTEKFIKNEQLNFIKKQIALIKDSTKKNVPQNILAAVIDLANVKILELFPNISLDQQEMLDLSRLKTDKEYEEYIQHLSGYMLPFPRITEQQLKKIFPKHKKLKLPDLSNIDFNHLTYLSWNDLRSNKKFIVYELEGKMVGIECEFAPTSKKNLCSFCNSFGEVSYFSTVTKAKKSKNPDYYKAVGNLICANSSECNKKITNAEYLETFLKDSLGL
ncbi:MAG TPA: FusB/FusC family EF-G-binding protein [Bacillus sp. (in: firmicutes)]|nr:FusB/FusC family EF-G-binding protein [Bacillus sp. (in: firmicutes)]